MANQANKHNSKHSFPLLTKSSIGIASSIVAHIFLYRYVYRNKETIEVHAP